MWGFSGDSGGEASTCQCRRCQRLRFDPWVGKIPWRKKEQPTPVFLPGKFQGQSCLAGYSPQGHKESDTTEQLNNKSVTWEHSVSRPWAAARTPLSRNVWRGPACLPRCLSVQHPAERIQGKSSPVWPWVTLKVQLNLRRNPSGCDEWGLAKAPLSFPNTGCRTEWQSKSPLAWPLRTWD